MICLRNGYGLSYNGFVLKARKKLDGLLYAIKRINLDPKSAQLKKRIIREVKLLSRLNHENVVRFVFKVFRETSILLIFTSLPI